MKNKIFKQSFTNVCFFGSCSVFCKKTPPLKSLYDVRGGVIPVFYAFLKFAVSNSPWERNDVADI